MSGPAPAGSLTSPERVEAAAYAKVTRRLLPFLFVCYIVAYLDRVNLGFAKLEMMGALGLGDAVYGTGAGIFFIGYFLFEVPSNLILFRVGARRWIARIMISWGVIAAAMMFASGAASFYGIRFVLGLAEAGFYPGVILYLTQWYPARRRARIIALFMTAIPLSSVLGGPLSGWILETFHRSGSLAGWQWLFLLEALPAVVLGVATLFYLPDGIKDARWLGPEEKQYLLAPIEAEARTKHSHAVGASLRHPATWVTIGVYIGLCMGLYGVSFWLPTLVKAAGVDSAWRIGLITAVPWAAGAVAMVLVGRSSDRSGERRWHLAIPTLLGAAGLAIAAAAGNHLLPALAGMTLATAGITTGLPLVWNLPTAVLGGAGAAAGIAFINSAGNLGGFLGPSLIGWIREVTHTTDAGLYVLAGLMLVSGLWAVAAPKAESR